MHVTVSKVSHSVALSDQLRKASLQHFSSTVPQLLSLTGAVVPMEHTIDVECMCHKALARISLIGSSLPSTTNDS